LKTRTTLADQTVDIVTEGNDIPIVRILQNCINIFPVAQEPNTGPGPLVFEVSRSHTIRHKLPVVLPCKSDELVAAYTIHTRKYRQCFQWEIEPAIPAIKLPQTYALDCTATGIA
jgi:hypothetical protein